MATQEELAIRTRQISTFTDARDMLKKNLRLGFRSPTEQECGELIAQQVRLGLQSQVDCSSVVVRISGSSASSARQRLESEVQTMEVLVGYDTKGDSYLEAAYLGFITQYNLARRALGLPAVDVPATAPTGPAPKTLSPISNLFGKLRLVATPDPEPSAGTPIDWFCTKFPDRCRAMTARCNAYPDLCNPWITWCSTRPTQCTSMSFGKPNLATLTRGTTSASGRPQDFADHQDASQAAVNAADDGIDAGIGDGAFVYDESNYLPQETPWLLYGATAAGLGLIGYLVYRRYYA